MNSRPEEPGVVLRQLIDALGDAVLTDQKNLAEARTDRSGKTSDFDPICVVEATSTDDVVAVMKIANQTLTPVVTRGAGSGLAGGAIGSAGEIVLSLAKMNKIIEISTENRWAQVQAGVINQDLNLAAQKLGLWFAPDPASRIWSTVGGNIATNAGGLLCAKYGVTREAVRQLTVVMADGEVMTLGHETVKGVTGFDLVGLLVGSEGTLGVITEAKVSLKPVDGHPVTTLSAKAADITLAARAIQETIRYGLQPSVFELIDETCSRYITEHLEGVLLEKSFNMLIAQTDGAGAAHLAEKIAQVWRDLGLEVQVEERGDELLSFRRAMLPALEARGKVLIEDVAVPISKLGEMLQAVRDIETQYGIEIPTVAHAGDGNLHPNFVYNDEEVPEHIWEAADAIFRKAISLGGTLTGEHGVGLLKRQWLIDELGQSQTELQWQIKKVFDPNNILNPGKVFDPEKFN
ncbi:MAG: FAD-binding oxidoreductase [Aquiluna sp.]|nr:FAD-binding oxidoreductase [Aquiluna sp.]